MVYFSKAKAKTKSKRTYYRKRFPKAKAKSNMYQVVKKICHRQMETKMADIEQTSKIVYGYLDGTTFVNLLPQILHGTGEAARVGNRVSCNNVSLKMSLYGFNQSTGTPPIWFDMYIYKVKNSVPVPPTNTQFQNFLEDGNTSTQYVGNVLDGLRKVNDELFTVVKRKRFLIYNPLNSANFIGASSNINPCRTMVINLTKHVKKNWIYNDNNGFPTNDTLYISIAATVSDGSLLPVGTQFGAYHLICECSYKDA